MSKLKREGILSTEGREKGYYSLAEEFEEEGANIEIPRYSVSLEKDLIIYLASDSSQIEKGLELKEKELKYYGAKFVVRDTASNWVRKVLIFIIVILSLW